MKSHSLVFGLCRTAFALMALLFVCLAHAAPTTPTTDFTDNHDGTVTHKITGLTWKRCSEGQTWTGSTCSGTAQGYSWAAATTLIGTFSGYSDWRLPTIAELETIVERGTTIPAINGTAFPNTPASFFWSASAYAGVSIYAWGIYFGDGDDYADFKAQPPGTSSHQVRLVRGGQIIDPWGSPEYTPTADFTDKKDGTVTHNKTSLTWKRCAEGQTWTGATCSGAAATYTWTNATTLTQSYAGYSDWRLPTQNELLTIVEWSTIDPAINPTIFPATAGWFWSASASAGNSSAAWYVDFSEAADWTSYQNLKTYSGHVRLVRGGQSIGTLVSLGLSCPTTLNAGASGQCSATATYSDGGSKSVVPSTWSLSGSAATLNSSGGLTGGTVSSDTQVTVTATYTEGGITKNAEAKVTVMSVAPTLSDLTIVCPAKTVSGAKDQCSATAVYTNGANKPVSAKWTAANPALLGIDPSGNLSTKGVAVATSVEVTASYTEGGVTKTKQANIVITPGAMGACAGDTPYTMLLTLNGVQTPTPLVIKPGETVVIDFCMANFDGTTLLDVYVVAEIPTSGVARRYYAFTMDPLFGTANYNPTDLKDTPRLLARQAIATQPPRVLLSGKLPANYPKGTTNIYIQAVPADHNVMDIPAWSKLLWSFGVVSFTY